MSIKKNVTFVIAWSMLAVCFLALTVFLFFANKTLFVVSLCLTLSVLLIFALNIYRIRKRINSMMALIGGAGVNNAPQSFLSGMEMPALVTDAENCVLWYNESFKSRMLEGKDTLLENITGSIPEFDVARNRSMAGCGYEIGAEHYLAFSGGSQAAEELNITLFALDTAQHRDAVAFKNTRPSVLLCTVDNYDELGGDTGESERAEVLTEVYRLMENFINSTNGIIMRLSNRNYLAIIEEQHIRGIIENRFPVLDKIRDIPTGTMPATMSIGIGRGAKTLFENNILARQALEMALGRGGDQAAMKTRGGYEFFGGESRGVEKRNKVKSRVVASALRDLITAADRVLIMGHKLSDQDALGASVGLVRFAQLCEAKANIVFDARTTMAKAFYDKLLDNGYGELFVTPAEAQDSATDKTLLIVVDCHVPSLVEDAQLLSRVKNIMLIDHHRKMVGYIDNAVLSYHEPYASSCSELVSELLQNVETADEKPRKIEAEGMLAGIMLDTKEFSVRTGVRTFEAASYLRRLGADPVDARLLFATDLETYRYKSQLVSSATIYRGCAIVTTQDLPENMRVVIPQAADDLLNIEGTSASVVAVKFQNGINISARSLGQFNVQLIMEYLGGGGHQTMAGVQLPDMALEEAQALIHKAIDSYLDAKQPSKENME
ncbi:MAG: DHH family phosphoesterase [Oscillospiraceae bacterium]|nr:DHH family phosphoesterase [Oscillospiraceae bacterium]